ncbi:MFS transporter [Bryobacter aggregatus]|uniref:MFS transporter n=1 Tax=Bryobacter aggregatus TaxID=360054 RepID=UPI0004E247DD|nr:MFS transporter [Bryobacter aggregatus]
MLIVAAVMAIFVYGMIAAMLGSILPDLSKRFSLTPSQNGAIATMQAIGLVIGSLLQGPLIDLQGKKVGLVLGLGLIALALFLLPKSKGFSTIRIYMLVLGIGGGIIVAGANALVNDVKTDNPTALFNGFNTFFGLGGIATPFIAANLLGGNSFKLCNLTAVLTVITLGLHSVTDMPVPTGVVQFHFSDVPALLMNPGLFLPALLLFLYVACEVGVWNWVVRHLIAQGINEKKALNILSFGFALGLLAGRLVVATGIFASFTNAQILMGASIGIAVTTYLMLQFKDANMAWAMVFAAGVAMAPVFPTALSMVGATFTTGTATAIGVAVTCGWLGLVTSSPIIGGVAGGEATGLKKALLLLPCAGVLMFLVTLAL